MIANCSIGFPLISELGVIGKLSLDASDSNIKFLDFVKVGIISQS